jgi:hypothetical protein
MLTSSISPQKRHVREPLPIGWPVAASPRLKISIMSMKKSFELGMIF